MADENCKSAGHYLLTAIGIFLGLAAIYYLIDLLFFTVVKNFGSSGPTPIFVDYLIFLLSFLVMTHVFSVKNVLRSKDPYYRYYFVALVTGIAVLYFLS